MHAGHGNLLGVEQVVPEVAGESVPRAGLNRESGDVYRRPTNVDLDVSQEERGDTQVGGNARSESSLGHQSASDPGHKKFTSNYKMN